tara:strand:- start:18989 stop:19516 length:528 start_codon:yes stop_codon:yes gene_type:complete
MKKAEIWISAVLYMALGIIILTIVLATSLPVVNKLKDKNTVVQTKNLMFNLDQNIRALYTEGPGSQRPIDLSINRGEFIINSDEETITWTLEDSRYIEVEPGASVKEGNLEIFTKKTPQQGKYEVKLKLDYKISLTESLLDLDSELDQISGDQMFLIRNNGDQGEGIPEIGVTPL